MILCRARVCGLLSFHPRLVLFLLSEALLRIRRLSRSSCVWPEALLRPGRNGPYANRLSGRHHSATWFSRVGGTGSFVGKMPDATVPRGHRHTTLAEHALHFSVPRGCRQPRTLDKTHSAAGAQGPSLRPPARLAQLDGPTTSQGATPCVGCVGLASTALSLSVEPCRGGPRLQTERSVLRSVSDFGSAARGGQRRKKEEARGGESVERGGERREAKRGR